MPVRTEEHSVSQIDMQVSSKSDPRNIAQQELDRIVSKVRTSVVVTEEEEPGDSLEHDGEPDEEGISEGGRKGRNHAVSEQL